MISQYNPWKSSEEIHGKFFKGILHVKSTEIFREISEGNFEKKYI